LALLVKSRIWSALAPLGLGLTVFGGVGPGASEEQNQVVVPTSAKPRNM
jgi:hypothetical protein